MPDLVVVKDETGKLSGLGEKGKRAWGKFLRVVKELAIGETMGFSYKLPRSPRHHRFFFCKLHELFDRQERFASEDHLLEWLKVGAGYADILPGRDGIPVAIPRSVNWVECEEQTFIEVSRGIDDFMWTEYAQATLWAHLSPQQRHENVEGWHETAERNRQLAIARMQAEGR